MPLNKDATLDRNHCRLTTKFIMVTLPSWLIITKKRYSPAVGSCLSLMGYNVLAKKVWGALSKAGDYRQAACSALTATLLFWEDVWPAAALLVHKQNAF